MNYYPIGIPTLCRYDHLRRCVESLQQNTHANKTELVIALDYPPFDKYFIGYNKISEYINSIEGFAKVTVLRHKENKGAKANWNFLRDYLFSISDTVIMSEDDNEFSPCFLDFMNKSLEKYKDNPKVYWVTGYAQPYMENTTTDDIIFKHGVCAYGIGLWREKEQRYLEKKQDYFEGEILNPKRLWNVLKRYPLGIPGEISMLYKNADYGDIRKGIYCRTENVYQLWPRISLVRNWGCDGSGEHSPVNSEMAKQKINMSSTFDLHDYPIQENPKELQYDRWTKFTDNKILLIKMVVKVPIYIIGYNIIRVFRK